MWVNIPYMDPVGDNIVFGKLFSIQSGIPFLIASKKLYSSCPWRLFIYMAIASRFSMAMAIGSGSTVYPGVFFPHVETDFDV